MMLLLPAVCLLPVCLLMPDAAACCAEEARRCCLSAAPCLFWAGHLLHITVCCMSAACAHSLPVCVVCCLLSACLLMSDAATASSGRWGLAYFCLLPAHSVCMPLLSAVCLLPVCLLMSDAAACCAEEARRCCLSAAPCLFWAGHLYTTVCCLSPACLLPAHTVCLLLLPAVCLLPV